MTGCYDRQGKPISLDEWARLFTQREAKEVVETTLPDGKWISTVWVGTDHNYSCPGGPPLIFETLVFDKRGDYEALDCDRYATEQEAIAGHEAMVEKWSRGREHF